MKADGGLVSETDEILGEGSRDASGSGGTRSRIGGRSWRWHVCDGDMCDAVWMRWQCEGRVERRGVTSIDMMS